MVAVVADLIKNQYLQRVGHFNAENTLDNSGSQNLFDIDVDGFVRVAVRIGVTVINFAAFAIQAKFHPDDADWVTLRSGAAEFISPTGILVDSSGDLTTLAAGANGWFVLDCAGFSRIRITGNGAAAGPGTVTMSGTGI